MNVRSIARVVTIALMGVAVIVATADGFAQSYAGLYGWAIEHGLTGWKADSFPLLVDTFVGVGELGMFLLAIDGHKLRKSLLSWADLLMPAAVAAAGWGASLVFNVGHVKVHDFATESTAAVPPLASMIGLLILLRTLHRYVTQVDVTAPVPVPATVTVEPILTGAESAPDPLAELFAGDAVPEAAEQESDTVPAVLPDPDPHQVHAASVFADEVRHGKVPGIRAIKNTLKIGQDKAQEVRDYLTTLAAQ
jgi:hypothetical protein